MANRPVTASPSAEELPEQQPAVPVERQKEAQEGAPYPRRTGRTILQRYAVVLTFVALIVIFSLTRTSTFFTVGNLQTILTTQAALLALTLLLTMTLASGELDLSIAGQLAFTAVLVAEMTAVDHISVAATLVVSLLASLGIGILNGLLVVRVRVNSFIVTLAMGTLLDGLASAISGSTTLGGVPSSLTAPFSDTFLGVGLPLWYMAGIAILLWYVLAQTPSGRRVYFTGEGREAARLAGIQVGRIRVVAFLLSALGAWLAGLIVLGQTGSAQASIGDPYLLPAYAAVFLGAATITPGRFNIVGTVIATFLLAVGTTGLQLFGLATWVTEVFDGGVLIVAVAFAAFVGVRET